MSRVRAIAIRLLVQLALVGAGAAARAEAPSVVASIAPLHGIVAAVMDGRGEPARLVDPHMSPHAYQLRPSDARLLAGADLVVRIGPAFDGFLDDVRERLAPDARVLTVLDLPLPVRLRYGTEPDEGEGPAREAGSGAHEHDHGHDHGGVDPHVWLEPANAVAIAEAVAATLAELDPEQAAQYRANATAFARRVERLRRELAARLEPLRGRGFAAAHEAFRYFARAFGLDFVGAFAVDPEVPAGAARLSRLRREALAGRVACLATEPQFAPRALLRLAEETGLPVVELDPLGAGLPPGPGFYEALLRRDAEALTACLGRRRSLRGGRPRSRRVPRRTGRP